MAISSAQLVIAGVTSTVYLNIEVTPGTQNIPNNTTSVAWSAWLSNSKYTYSYAHINGLTMTINVGGTTVATATNLQYNFKTTGSARSQCVQSGTTTITHNSDGTKSIDASVALVDTKGSTTNKTVSIASFALTTIPRASTIVSFSAFNNMSTSISVNFSRKSSSFTHYVYVKIGTTTIYEGYNDINGAGTLSLTDAQRVTMYNAVSGSSATATLTLYTVTPGWGATIGTATATATCTVYKASTIASFSAFNTESSGYAVNITRTTTSYSLAISMKIGSTTINTWTSTTTGAQTLATSQTVKNNLYTALAGATSATATLSVVTKYGSVVIGSTATATTTCTNNGVTTISSFSAFNTSSTNISFTLARKTTTLTHYIYLHIGATQIAVWNTAIDGAQTLTLTAAYQNALLDAIPASKTATATLTVYTTNTGWQATIGSVATTAVCTVNATNVPVVSGITIGYSNPTSAITGATRNYAIQSITNVTINATLTAPRGTTINNSTVRLGTAYVYTCPGTLKANASGTITVSVETADKRGYIGSASTTISVLPYLALTAAAPYIGRPRGAGAQARLEVDLRATVSQLAVSGSTTNGYKILIQTQPVAGGTVTTYATNTYNPGYAANTLFEYATATVYTETSAYNVTITVQDDFSGVTLNGLLSTALYPLVVGDIGIGVGKVPDDDMVLDVGGNAKIDGPLYISGSGGTLSRYKISYNEITNELDFEYIG